MAYKSILDIKEILDDYCKDVQDDLENTISDNAKLAVKELRANSPKTNRKTSHKGRYAKGWRVKSEKGFGHINSTIYNKTDWQLTHLLEKGHLTRSGSKTKPIVHIAPVEEKYCNKTVSDFEKIIVSGGKG